MLYTALWYYPVIMAGAGLTTMVWDLGYIHATAGFFKKMRRRKPSEKAKSSSDIEKGSSWASDPRSSGQDLWKPLPPPPPAYSKHGTPFPSPSTTPRNSYHTVPLPLSSHPTVATNSTTNNAPPSTPTKPRPFPTEFSPMTWKVGLAIILFFLITFILVLTLHSLTHNPTRPFSLFSSLYLAGTIIFGGGPVVIPLLRDYIVTPSWVTPRDFLLGLAVIQAFPGPNFNFAVYLGALAVKGTALPSYLGALIAFVAMYAPGLFIVVGFMGLWKSLRERAWFLALLRGVNAAAVGLVWSAVYKLWEIGYMTPTVQGGQPLGTDPWLVAITGTAFAGGAWFGLNAPVAILLGGGMGMARYGLVLLK